MKTLHPIFILFFFILAPFFIPENTFAQNTSKWIAPSTANQLENPLKGDQSATQAGKKIYMQYCFVCHGNTGKGDGMAGMSLNPRPSDFTSALVQDQTDGALFWKITEGRSPMASYKEILNEKQRWQVVNFIRTLKK